MPNRSGSVPTAIYNSPLDDRHDEGEEDALDVFLDDKIPSAGCSTPKARGSGKMIGKSAEKFSKFFLENNIDVYLSVS